MNKEQLIEELGKIDRYIWDNAPRVPAMDWEVFSDNILNDSNAKYWNELGLQELEEAYERGSFIMRGIINDEYPKD